MMWMSILVRSYSNAVIGDDFWVVGQIYHVAKYNHSAVKIDDMKGRWTVIEKDTARQFFSKPEWIEP